MRKINLQNLILGFFDGLHQGHKLLFNGLENFGVLTFKNIPHKVNNFLYPLEERIKQIKKLSPQIIYIFDILKFNMEASKFLRQVIKPLNIKRLVVGSDYHFGNDNEGATKILEYFPDSIIVKRTNVSSSLLKKLIIDGDLESANNFLFEPYYRSGKVIDGIHKGKLLGYPTANIAIDHNLISLKPGSYVSVATFKNKNYLAVTFVGKSKTLDEQKNMIEAHILNFSENLYGENIKISFLKFIRPPSKFNNIESLKEAIKKDILFTTNWNKINIKFN